MQQQYFHGHNAPIQPLYINDSQIHGVILDNLPLYFKNIVHEIRATTYYAICIKHINIENNKHTRVIQYECVDSRTHRAVDTIIKTHAKLIAFKNFTTKYRHCQKVDFNHNTEPYNELWVIMTPPDNNHTIYCAKLSTEVVCHGGELVSHDGRKFLFNRTENGTHENMIGCIKVGTVATSSGNIRKTYIVANRDINRFLNCN